MAFFLYKGETNMIKRLILGSMQTNCYVVYNEAHQCVVIDPGSQGKKVSHYIEENKLTLLGILLTHGHFDHVGAVDYLYLKYHCPIYTHQETLPLLHDSSLNLSNFEEPFIVEAPIQCVDHQLNICDFHFTWLLLEGHCQGSSMIYYPQEDVLFSGDVLFKGSIGRFDFPTSSHLETKKSLNKIGSLDFDAKILPGHGEESTLHYEKMNNPYLKS